MVDGLTVSKVGEVARLVVEGGGYSRSGGRAAIYAYTAAGMAFLFYLSLLRHQRSGRGKGERLQGYAVALRTRGEAAFEGPKVLRLEHAVDGV